MARQTGRVIQKIECQAKTAGYQAGIRHVYPEGRYDFVEIIDAPGPETRCWALPYGITKKDLALCSLFQRSVTKQYRR